MAEHRPFPPSPRRRALARQAGLHAASPWITGALAALAAVLAVGATGSLALHRLGVAIVAACRAGAEPGPASLLPLVVPRTVLDLALPLLVAAALAALIAHLAQTRAAWLPAAGSRAHPGLETGPIPRVRRAGGDLAAGAALAAVAFGWLWWMAPRIAALVAIAPIPLTVQAAIVASPAVVAASPGRRRRFPGRRRHFPGRRRRFPGRRRRFPGRRRRFPGRRRRFPGRRRRFPGRRRRFPAAIGAAASPLLAGTAALLVSLAATLAVAWLALGVVDALARNLALSRALAMTSTEKREDDRLAGADPRWRAGRAAVQRGPRLADAMATASVLLLGDDLAVAIAWDPRHRPLPVRTATGRGPRARQLLGLARRHRIAIHRDTILAAALVDGEGPVPEPHWPRLANILAATLTSALPRA